VEWLSFSVLDDNTDQRPEIVSGVSKIGPWINRLLSPPAAAGHIRQCSPE